MMLRSYRVNVSCGVLECAVCSTLLRGGMGDGYRICAFELAEEHSLVSSCNTKALIQKAIQIVLCLDV